MKKIQLLLFCVGLIIFNYTYAQPTKIDTLQYNGDINKFINIVIMGDGYTGAEQSKFVEDAQKMSDYIFSLSPWKEYQNYFNVFAIEVISAESGISHPATSTDGDCSEVPKSTVNTYFSTRFDYGGIHRLVVPTNYQNISSALAAYFPQYDQVIILANSSYYGGSGGAEATSTTHSSSPEIVAHEIAHSFASLGDEYYAGDQYNREKPNMTQETDPTLVRWKNWLYTNDIGIYPYGTTGNQALWFRPHQNCKMRYLGKPYCNVCSQTIIEKIHKLTNVVLSYKPVVNDVFMPEYNDFTLSLIEPIPNTLNIQWQLDDNPLDYNNMDTIRITHQELEDGLHTLSAVVVDTTDLLRVDGHSAVHFSKIDWTINRSVLVMQIQLSPKNLTLLAGGDSATLEYSILPSDATNKVVSWTSTNPSVASVNDGVVFGLTEGETDIIVTTQDGGLSDTCHLAVFAVGIHDNEIPSFAVYPNPALSKITVSADITGESVVEVIDMAGNVVYSIAMTSEGTLELSIDMSDFGAGTYFVHLTNGKEQAIEKVIKK